jgi:hypothetical protein
MQSIVPIAPERIAQISKSIDWVFRSLCCFNRAHSRQPDLELVKAVRQRRRRIAAQQLDIDCV